MTQTLKEIKKKKLKAISLPIRSDLSTVSNYPYEFAEKDHKDQADKTRQVKDTINLVKPQLLDPTNWIIEYWFEAGVVTFIQGDEGRGKSRLCFKFAVLNKHKEALWQGGPRGDGRKSLYLCKERSNKKGIKNELACGAKCQTECMDIMHNITLDKGLTTETTEEIDLSKTEHIKCLFDIIKKNNYAFVFIDPIAEMLGAIENKNFEVRKFFNKEIRPNLQDQNFSFVGITHYRKERAGTSRTGRLMGASTIKNIAECILSVEEFKDTDDFVLIRDKLTDGNKNIGGIKFKVESIPIPSHNFKDKKQYTHGGIKQFEYINEHVNKILSMCKPHLEIPTKTDSINSLNTYLTIIKETEADNKIPYLKEVRLKALARGVSTYYDRHIGKQDWNTIGYYWGKAEGIENKIPLKPIPESGVSEQINTHYRGPRPPSYPSGPSRPSGPSGP